MKSSQPRQGRPAFCVAPDGWAKATTFLQSNTQNEETTAETEYTPITEVEETFSTNTDPQPIELDTAISEIITQTIPCVLMQNNNDEILIAIRQPYRCTSWIWTSTKRGRLQVRW